MTVTTQTSTAVDRGSKPPVSDLVMETIACPACGSNAARPVIATPDYETNGKDQFQIVECSNCSLAYTSPRPFFDELLKKFYADDYLCYNKSGMMSRLRTSLLGRSRIGLLRKYMKPGARLVDVGCADGDLLSYLKEKTDFQVTGCEPKAEVAAAARRRDLDVVDTTLRNAGFPSDYFDVVFMSHVIEHLPDVAETTKEIFRILKPGGVLITENPDFTGRTRRLFGRAWWAYHLPRHLTHFTPATERQFLEQRGFKVETIEWCFRPSLLAWSIRNWIKASRLPNVLCRLFGQGNPAFVLLMFPFEYLNLKSGSTDVILVVARKPQ